MNGEKKEIPKGTLGLVELYCLSIGQVIGAGVITLVGPALTQPGILLGLRICWPLFWGFLPYSRLFLSRHTSAGRRLLLPHWSADQQDVSGNVRVCAAYKAFEHLIVCGEPGGVCPVFVSAGQHHGLRGGVPDVFLCGESVRN